MGEMCLVGCGTPDNAATPVTCASSRPMAVNWGSTAAQCCRRSNASMASRRVSAVCFRVSSPGTGAGCPASAPRPHRFVALPGSPCAMPYWSAHEQRHVPSDVVAVHASSSVSSAGVASMTEEEMRTADSHTHRDGSKGWLSKTKEKLKIPELSSPAQIRQLLVKMGTSVVLAYGFTSNLSNIGLVIASWYMFWIRTGLSPLSQGQWGAYLLTLIALYATIGNLLRPVRIIVAAAIGPTFDDIVAWMQAKLHINKPFAIATTCLLINGVGSAALLTAGMVGASVLTGMPILPGSVIPVSS